MSISIHHPVSPARVALKFAASGFTKSRPTDFPMSGVIGKLTPDGGGADVYGKTVSFRAGKGMGGNKHHWIILFVVPAAGAYTLEVTGVRADGKMVGPEKVPKISVVGGGRPFIRVAHPPDNYHLTPEEKDYFVVYGETSGPTVLATSATLGAVPADYVDTSTSDQIWWATFPSLNKGTYPFTVQDNTTPPLSESTTGIVVP